MLSLQILYISFSKLRKDQHDKEVTEDKVRFDVSSVMILSLHIPALVDALFANLHCLAPKNVFSANLNLNRSRH